MYFRCRSNAAHSLHWQWLEAILQSLLLSLHYLRTEYSWLQQLLWRTYVPTKLQGAGTIAICYHKEVECYPSHFIQRGRNEIKSNKYLSPPTYSRQETASTNITIRAIREQTARFYDQVDSCVVCVREVTI